jgi:hypothetical protein
MRPSFRNVARHPCITVLSLGLGIAGSIATLRFDSRRPSEPLGAKVVRAAVEPMLGTPPITAVHLGRETASTTPPSMQAQGWCQPTEDAGRHVLLVEGPGRHELEAARPRLAEMLRQQLDAVGDISFAAFDLAFVVERVHLPGPTTRRQADRADLHRRWQMETTPRR